MQHAEDAGTESGSVVSRAARAALATGLPFLFLCQWAIFSGRIPARARYDQLLYHEPAIRGFVSQWPAFDFYDYLSATTPGYHVLLACVAKFCSPHTAALQIAGAVIGAVFVGGVAAAAAMRTTTMRAVAFTLPLACSLYVFTSGAWLLPDNLGWLGVTLIVLIALRERFSWGWLAAGGVVLLGLVFTRQIHLWAAAALWAAAFFAPVRGQDVAELSGLRSDAGRRIGRALTAVLVTLPAFGLVYAFVDLWGGLTPPRFQLQYSSVNPAAVPFFLAVFGGLSVFFLPTLLPRLVGLVRERRRATIVVAVAAVAAIVPATNYDYFAGRRTGLWNLVQKFPVIGGHTSPLVVVLAVWGGVCLAAWLGVIDLRRRLVLLVTLAGFWAAQAASVELWQRYVEPFALVLLALLAAFGSGAEGGAMGRVPALMRRAEIAFPVTLAIVFVALNVRGLVNAPMIADGPPAVRSTDDRSDIPAPPEVVVPAGGRRGLWW